MFKDPDFEAGWLRAFGAIPTVDDINPALPSGP